MENSNEEPEILEHWTIKMKDREWERIAELRVFRQGEVQEARAKIDALVLAFRIYQIDREKIPEYRNILRSAGKAVRNLESHFSAMGPLSRATELKIERGLLIKHPHRALLEKEYLDVIKKALRLLDGQLKEGLALVTTGDKGTEDVYHLVNILNEVVVEHSDGGRLSRSDTKVKGRGNNVQFVTEVLKLATQYTDREIGPGTIIEAIRHLKEPQQANGRFTFSFEIPESEMPEEKTGKSILQAVFRGIKISSERTLNRS